jgi:tRNA(fMet)-specific endonuclease VapC
MLLDTNTLVHYLKGREAVVSRLQSASPRDLAIPSVVACEIEYGALKLGSSRRQKVVRELLAGFEQAPFDHETARKAAQIRVELESQGVSIGPLDLLIAGTAASLGAVLVTSNTGEFSHVKGLRLSDWTL